MTGELPDKLRDAPEFPSELSHVWEIFMELSTGRREGLNGLAALDWCSIDSYCRLTERRFSYYELTTLRRLDNIWLRIGRKEWI